MSVPAGTDSRLQVSGPRVGATDRPWLVFTSAGDAPNCAAWLREDRMFDLWAVHYGERLQMIDGSDLFSRRKGSKFQNLWSCYRSFPELIERYRAVLVMDDDLEIDADSIEALFRVHEREGLLALQPAFDPRGRVSHRVTMLNPLCELRLTSFIEVTCPLFRTDVLVDFLRRYGGSLVGWGVDEWFCAELLRRNERGLGIVDAVTVLNPHEKRKAARVREIDLLQKSRDRRLAWESVAEEMGIPSTCTKRTVEHRYRPRPEATRQLFRWLPELTVGHTRLTKRRLNERLRRVGGKVIRRVLPSGPGLAHGGVATSLTEHARGGLPAVAARRGQMKVLVLPRDPNPYQESLYGRLREAGLRTRYLQELTGRGGLDLLILPLEVVALRLRGWRTLHLHWVYGFGWPGGAAGHSHKRLAEAWFAMNLRLWRALGIAVVWTAHNTLPHEPVFADDVRARRRLGEAARQIVVHQSGTIDELRHLGIDVRKTVVLPMPAYGLPDPAPRAERSDGRLSLLFFGLVRPYKGVELLLEALAGVDPDLPISLRVVGSCTNPELAQAIDQAAGADPRIQSVLERVSDERLAQEISRADFVVVPGTRITNSSTVAMAMGGGRPVIVADIPAFRDLPEACAARFDGTALDLGRVIEALLRESGPERARRATAAAQYAAGLPSWDELARETLSLLSGAASHEE